MLATAGATLLAMCGAPSTSAITASAHAAVTRPAPQVLDRASARNLIDAFNLATCWDCAIGIDGCYRVHALGLIASSRPRAPQARWSCAWHGRVFALGDHSVKHSVLGAGRRDVQRIPKHLAHAVVGWVTVGVAEPEVGTSERIAEDQRRQPVGV